MKADNRRILVIDDDREIWLSYQKVLLPAGDNSPGKQMARLLGRGKERTAGTPTFELLFAPQGKEGFAMVEDALRLDEPFALIFVDIRMPPGWDGMETAAKIRAIDPNVEIVIVTAYSDRSQEEIVQVVGAPDKLLFFRKPFDADELQQIAISLTAKWNLSRLEEEQRRDLQTVLQTTPAAIFTVDGVGTVLSWNPAAEQITGYTAGEIIGGHCPFDGHLMPRACHTCLLNDALDGDAAKTREVGFVDKSGCKRTILIRLSKVFDRKGQFVKAVESFWDITVLKETEIALHDSEDRFRALVETISDLVWEVDREGRFTYCSPVCGTIYGYRPEELVGQKIFEALSMAEEVEHLEQLFQGCARRRQGFQTVVRRCRRKDGQLVYVETSAVPVIDGMGRLLGLRGIDRDITARKKNEEERARLEEQYRQSQKMESLGTLAGGIAHDLNNVLTPIIGNAELALLLLRVDNHPAVQKVEDILKCSDRAAELIRKILAFSRKQVLRPTVLDLNVLVADLTKLLRRLIREDIRMEVDLAEDLLSVSGDQGQMEQILMNLVVNAGDAVTGDGRIVVRTRNETVVPGTIADVDGKALSGTFVVLSVSDNGSGMDQETLARIFEPFFTTKDVGKGTGMGLSTVYGIVQQHGGHLRIETALGKGTTFFVYLAGSRRAVTLPEREAPSASLSGSETVLLAEDDVGVRSVTALTLREFGYRVLEAADGQQALTVFVEAGGAVDLLITDVIMPGIHGDEVARQLRHDHPELPVLYISGHTFDMSAKELARDSNSVFMQKPFRQGALVRAVRELLDREAESR